MSEIAFEATVQDSRIVLPEDLQLPDNTRVHVVVSTTGAPIRVRMMSPRLANPSDSVAFTMQVELEGDDASLR
jgi:hypothetical protein